MSLLGSYDFRIIFRCFFIIYLLFTYYLPIIYLLFTYYFPIMSLLLVPYYLSIIHLLFP